MRTSTCSGCGASVVRAINQHDGGTSILEPVGFGAMVWNDGVVRWGNIHVQHACQPAAVEARQAYIESVTTEEERRQASVAEEQRQLAKAIANEFDCPKPKCEAKAGEPCINLTILNRSGERQPTSWPHPERMKLAVERLEAEQS